MRDPSDRPNIVLINCDDLGYGDIGAYGSLVNDTPHIDRLAAKGLRFTDFYMAAPVCTPSRAAMMTGCYPSRVGMDAFRGNAWVLYPGDAYGLNPEERTIASLLRDRGYATALMGKWHLGDQPDFLPDRHGFDRYFGLPYSNDMGRQTGREHLPPLPLMEGDQVIEQQPDQSSITERYVEHSVRFMRENRDQPFFLYLAHMYVHVPLFAPKVLLDRSRNSVYGACVAYIDWSVGVIQRELRRLGLERNTLVIFTSDNGSRGANGASNRPLRGKKGTTWEGGQRLPCIMSWPGALPQGATTREMTTAMDLLPTICRLADAPIPTDRTLDGRDITPILFDEPGAASPHDCFYYYLRNNLEAVRAGRWKLHTTRHELYDLADDPGEACNLIGQHPSIADRLEGLAETGRRDLGDGASGTVGAGQRPVGCIADPQPLTSYDPTHPYIISLYDTTDTG